MPETNPLLQIRALAKLMRSRQEAGDKAYTLVLGSGASLASGRVPTEGIIEDLGRDYGQEEPAARSREENLAVLYDILDRFRPTERYTALYKYLKGTAPSPGYHHLAALVRAGYFDLLLSTNLDHFLENALVEAGLRIGDDFLLLVNGRDREGQIVKALNFPTPSIKVLKLHGDLGMRILVFTPGEVFQFAEKIEATLKQLLRRDLLIVGYSLKDDDIRRCIETDGGALWYVNAITPIATDSAYSVLRARGGGQVVSGPAGEFDHFFAWLRLELLLAEVSLGPEEQSLLEEMRAYQRQEDSAGMAAALSQLAKACAKSGHRELALLCYECSAASFRETDDKSNAARTLRELGTLHANLNHPQEAMRCYRQSQSLSSEAGDRKEEALTLAMMGQWWWAARRSRKAAECREKAIAHWVQSLPVLQEFNLPEARRVERWLQEAKEKSEAS